MTTTASHPYLQLVKYVHAHQPGIRLGATRDMRTATAIQRIGRALAEFEAEAPGSVERFEDIIDVARAVAAGRRG